MNVKTIIFYIKTNSSVTTCASIISVLFFFFTLISKVYLVLFLAFVTLQGLGSILLVTYFLRVYSLLLPPWKPLWRVLKIKPVLPLLTVGQISKQRHEFLRGKWLKAH
jgi:hypothetical protein